MPLRDVKVLEFSGLVPAPFCGKILSDLGASVTLIDKVHYNPFEVFRNGKRILPVNLKSPAGQSLVQELSKSYDVVLEPFRPGVMENLNLGPETLCKANPKLIYARLTGFGQFGRLANRAGHDINFVAMSGILSLLRSGTKPTPPVNLLGDLAGGGMLCALGICMALLERHRSGKGQVIDSSMVEGAAYVSTWLLLSQKLPIRSLFQSEAFFYDTYQTKDGKYMSVGPLEPQFFEKFIQNLGLPSDTSQFESNEESKELVKRAFLEKTQKEWSDIFEDIDACVYPVLEWESAPDHDHNKERQSFIRTADGDVIPQAAPKLSRTPGSVKLSKTEDPIQVAAEILADVGKTLDDVIKLNEEGVLSIPVKGKL